MVGRKEGKKDMRMYKVTSCMLVILMVTFFSGCEKKQNEIIGLQLSGQQDILTYDEGVVWNTGEDVLLKKKGETNGTSIFQDPFYEKKMDEDIIKGFCIIFGHLKEKTTSCVPWNFPITKNRFYMLIAVRRNEHIIILD